MYFRIFEISVLSEWNQQGHFLLACEFNCFWVPVRSNSLHHEKNPGYLLTKTVCLSGESFQTQDNFVTPFCPGGNLKAGITSVLCYDRVPLETHTEDLQNYLHKMQLWHSCIKPTSVKVIPNLCGYSSGKKSYTSLYFLLTFVPTPQLSLLTNST